MRNPARSRRYLFGLIAAGLVLLLAGSVPLQLEGTPGFYRPMLLVLVMLGLLVAVPSSLALTLIELTALRRPALQGALHDELSTRNSVRAMAVGYVVFVLASVFALPLSAILRLPTLSVLTAVVLLGIIAHAGSFAWFERQGDDG